MRNFLHFLILSLLCFSFSAEAQVKISSYPQHTALADADDLLINKKVTGGYSTARTAISNFVEYLDARTTRTSYNTVNATNIYVSAGANAFTVFATNKVHSALGEFVLLNAGNANVTNTLTAGTVNTTNFSGTNGNFQNLTVTQTASARTNRAGHLTVTNRLTVRAGGDLLFGHGTTAKGILLDIDELDELRFRKNDGNNTAIKLKGSEFEGPKVTLKTNGVTAELTNATDASGVNRGVKLSTPDNPGDPYLQIGEFVQIKTGSGSPEGVVAATRGTIYLRLNGGTGSTLYVKESGTGNTGWAAK